MRVQNPLSPSRRDVATSRRWNVATLAHPYFSTLEHHHIVTLGVFDSNFMSSHFRSHHVMSCHVTSHHLTSRPNIETPRRWNVAMFLVWMNNVAMFLANVATLLEIYEQRCDVGHERRDVVGFSNNEKSAKI